VVTACASSLHAIGLASRLIRYGDADLMVAGGSEASLTRLGIAAFAAMRALSTRKRQPRVRLRPSTGIATAS
jgi:3-oxoacyl-[acyl-carrier-protein] synthase II